MNNETLLPAWAKVGLLVPALVSIFGGVMAVNQTEFQTGPICISVGLLILAVLATTEIAEKRLAKRKPPSE